MLEVELVRKESFPEPNSAQRAKDVSGGVIGTSQLARMFDKTDKWARRLLRDWYQEQENGGPVRVFKRKGRGPYAAQGALYTTLAVIQREMPAYRDPLLMRRLHEYERDLDSLARRVDFLTSEVRFLRKKINA